MSIAFKFKGKYAINDIRDFCRLNDELTYIGQFAYKDTSLVTGHIIQHNGEFYTTESPLKGGISTTAKDKNGMITTTVELFKTKYVPEQCKSLRDCSIYIDIWDFEEDDKAPYESYAFDSDQFEEAKVVLESNENVDIFIDGMPTSKKDFLENY